MSDNKSRMAEIYANYKNTSAETIEKERVRLNVPKIKDKVLGPIDIDSNSVNNKDTRLVDGVPQFRSNGDAVKDFGIALAGAGVGIVDTAATGAAFSLKGWNNIGQALGGHEADSADEWINNTRGFLGTDKAKEFLAENESEETKYKRNKLAGIMQDPNIGEIERYKQVSKYYVDNPDMLGLDTTRVIPQSVGEMFIGGKFIQGTRGLNALAGGTKAGINAAGSMFLNGVNNVAMDENESLTPENILIKAGTAAAGGLITKVASGGKGYDFDRIGTGGSTLVSGASIPKELAKAYSKEYLEEGSQEWIEAVGQNYIEDKDLLAGTGGASAAGAILGAMSSGVTSTVPTIAAGLDSQDTTTRQKKEDARVQRAREFADVNSENFNPEATYNQAIRDLGSDDVRVREAASNTMSKISDDIETKLEDFDTKINEADNAETKAALEAEKTAFEETKVAAYKGRVSTFMNFVGGNNEELFAQLETDLVNLEAERSAVLNRAVVPEGMPNTESTGVTESAPVANNTANQSAGESKYSNLINAKSQQYGVPSSLIHAIVKTESGYNPNAVSAVGAKGLMQLMSGTAGDLKVRDRANPEQNIDGGVRYIKQLLKRYDGNITNALLAYNWGMGNVDAFLKTGKGRNGKPMPKEAREYVGKIRANARSIMQESPIAGKPSKNNYLEYVNSKSKRNEKLHVDLEDKLSFLGDMGITFKVNSGGQSKTSRGFAGGPGHNHGKAGDGDLYMNGKILSWNNPQDLAILEQVVEEASARGINGIGAGYMGKGSSRIHFGIQTNDASWGSSGKTKSSGFRWIQDAQARGRSRSPNMGSNENTEVNEDTGTPLDLNMWDDIDLTVEEESEELAAITAKEKEVKERGQNVIRNTFSTMTPQQIEDNTLLNTAQKEALKKLSDVKAKLAKLKDLSKVESDIYEGDQKSTSSDPLKRNLGARQYNEILTQVVAVNDTQTVSKYLGFLNRFAENHDSKNEIMQKLKGESSNSNRIPIAPNEQGVWVDARNYSASELKEAGSIEVRGDNVLTKSVLKEATMLKELRDSWVSATSEIMNGVEILIPNPVTPKGFNTSVPVPVTAPAPIDNTSPIETGEDVDTNVPVSTTPTPIKATATPTAAVSTSTYTPVKKFEETGENGFYLGRGKDTEGNVTSMSIINPEKEGSEDNIGNPGWLGDENKNKPIDAYIQDVKKYATMYEKFVPQLIEDLAKDLYGYATPAKNSETNFLADLSVMIKDMSPEEVTETINNIKSYTKADGIRLATKLSDTTENTFTDKIFKLDTTNKYGLNTVSDINFEENKAAIDTAISENINMAFPSKGLGNDIKGSAPKTFKYLNEQLKSRLDIDNNAIIRDSVAPVKGDKVRSSNGKGKEVGKASAPITGTKTMNEKSNKSATGDKEYTNQYTYARENDSEWRILINRNEDTNEVQDVSYIQDDNDIETITVPDVTLNDEAIIKWLQEGKEKIQGVYKQTNYSEESVDKLATKTSYVNKSEVPTELINKAVLVTEVMSKFLALLDPKNIKEADSALFVNIINTLNNFNPDLKLELTDAKIYNNYNENLNTLTINPGNTEHVLREMARLSIESSTAVLADELGKDSFNILNVEDKAVVKLNNDLTYIKQIINRNGLLGTDEKIDIEVRKRLLNALSSNSKLLSAATTDMEIMAYLQSIPFNLENNKAKSSVFNKIVSSLRSFFNIGNTNKIANMYDKLLEITARTAEIQAINSKVSFSSSEEGKAGPFQNLVEAESKLEMKKSYYVRDNLKAKFKQTTNRSKPLSGIANFTSKLKLDLMQGINKVTRVSPNTAQREQVQDYLKFKDELSIHLMDTFVQKTKKLNDDGTVKYDFTSQDLKSNLMNENGEIDENTLAAASLAAYDWIAEFGNKTSNMDKDIKKLLNLDPEDKTYIRDDIKNQYIDGVMLKDTKANGIGNKVLQLLNIEDNGNGSIEVQSELASSVGEWIVNAMQSADLIHIRDMSSIEHFINIFKVGGELTPEQLKLVKEEVELRRRNDALHKGETKEVSPNKGRVTFMSAVDTKGKNRNPRLQEVVDKSKGTLNFMQSLFGSDIGMVHPTTKMPTEVITKIKGSPSTIHASQAADMRTMQEAPIQVNDTAYNALTGLLGKYRSQVLHMLKASVTDAEIAAEHVSDRHSLTSSADGQLREVESMMDFISTLVKGANGKREVFFDMVYGAKNSRMHYKSNTVNFQLSKIHRSVTEYANFETEIDITELNKEASNWFNEDGTTSNLGFMLRGIMEGAEGTKGIIKEALDGSMYTQGFTVDKLPSSAVLDPFMAYVRSDEQVQKAMQAATKVLADVNSVTKEDMQNIEDLVNFWDGGPTSFRSLLELTMLMNATGDTITTSIGLGSDGVNNGIAISTIQMGVANAKFLAQVGIITDAEKYALLNGYYDTRLLQELGDYYEGLEKLLVPYLDSMTGKAESLIKLNTSIKERSFMKAVLIPFGYSAGKGRLNQIAFSQTLEDIKDSFKKLAKMEVGSDEAIKLKGSLEENLSNVIGTKVNLPDGKAILEFWFTGKEINELARQHELLIASTITKGIEEYAGEFIKQRNLNVKIQNLQSDLYLAVKVDIETKAKEEYREILREGELYKDLTDTQLDTLISLEGMPRDFVTRNIESKLQKLRPSIRTPFNTGTNDVGSDFAVMGSKKTLKANEASGASNNKVSDNTLVSSTGVKTAILRMIEESVGITVSSAQVQGVDAFIAAWASARGGSVNRNIHDQGDSGVNNVITMGKAQNQATFEALKIYHVQSESMAGLARTIDGLTYSLNIGDITKETFDAAIEAMLSKLVSPKIKNRVINRLKKEGVLPENPTKLMIFDEVTLPLISDILDGIIATEHSKLNTLKSMRVVQQYAGENAEYLVTDADRASVDDQYQVVRDMVSKVGRSFTGIKYSLNENVEEVKDTKPVVKTEAIKKTDSKVKVIESASINIEELLIDLVKEANKTDNPISNVENKMYRYLIDAMKAVNPELTLTIVSKKGVNNSLGAYYSKDNRIVMYKESMDQYLPHEQASILAHEIVHALTTNKMHYSQDPVVVEAFNEIQEMYEELRAKAPDYMTQRGGTMENVFEMIAYGMTEARHTRWIVANLNSKDYSNGKSTSDAIRENLKRFVNLVKNFLLGDKENTKEYLVGVRNFERMQELMDITIKELTAEEKALVKSKPINFAQYSTAQAIPIDNLKSLPTGNNSTKHVEHLDKIIDSVVVDKLNRSVEDNNEVVGIINNVSQRAISAGFALSDKELYSMEIVKVIVNEYLKENSDSKSVQEMRNIFDSVTNQLTKESFLSDPANATASEIKIAQSKLRYIKGQDKLNQKEQVERFIALITTSEEFRNITDKLSTGRNRTRNDGWFDRAMAVLDKIVSFITGKVLNITNLSNPKQVDELIKRVGVINKNARDHNLNVADRVITEGLKYVTSPLNNSVNYLIDQTFETIAKGATFLPITSSLRSVMQASVKAKKTGLNNIGEQLIMNNTTRNGGSERLNGWGEFVNEIVQTKGMKQTVEELVRMNSKVGQLRDTVKKSTIKVVASYFTDNGIKLSEKATDSLTRVILRTDISSLLNNNYQIARVLKLLTDTSERLKEISKLEAVIETYSNSNDILIQTKSLALYMAKEEISNHLVKNAENIAIGKDSWYEISMENMDTTLRDSIDSLASLYAVEYASKDAKTDLIALIAAEEEGIKAVLQVHKDMGKANKEGFKDNPYNYIKGFVPQSTNGLKSLIFAENADEVTKLESEGWIKISSSNLEQDKLDNTNSRSLMYHNDMLHQDYVSGALDMKDTHSKGTTVYNLKSLKDLQRIEASKLRDRRMRVNSVNFATYDPRKVTNNSMIAGYNSEGQITSYGYEMSGEMRDNYLERNNNGLEMLGILESDAKFKPAIAESQRNVAKALHEDFLESYGSDPRQYISIDPNSQDEKVQVMYRMMPYAFKAEATKLFGKGNPIVIRSNVYNAVFGFKSYSITEMFDAINDEKVSISKVVATILNAVFGKTAKSKVLQAERMYQKGIDKMKNFIVIRNHAVLVGNLVSNALLLSLKGVPPSQQIKDFVSVWRNGGNYRKLATRVSAIDVELKVNQSRPREISKLKRERNIALKAMEQNPMHSFMEAGLMSTIVEDIGMGDKDNGYKSEFDKKVEKLESYIPEQVRTVFDWVLMSPGTPLNDFMKHSTQFSDLAAKYSLATHMMKNGTSMKDAITEAQDSFINYDVPTGRGIDYMNRVGLFMFTKFFIRFQQVMLNLLNRKAGSTIGQHVAIEQLTGFSGVLDPLAVTRLGNNPFSAGILNYDEAFGNISTVNAISSILN